ncbi:hypothetical protein Acr_00g0076390 [Actinidia rufa]|uniref:Uncharacterized protein n=1 Tax=Actinidia rufa TaxID=165716 RepID=A0A7J0DSX0_9ERIC|nr:hypothetical protein Acr_00g0076390 [Actinidia rufa]
MHFQTEVPAPSHLGALLPSPGCTAKYVALQVVVTPSLLPCVHNWRDPHHLSRAKETRFGDVAPVAVHRLCLFPLSFSMDILHWLHLLVSGQTSARIPKHLLALLYYSGSFKYILLISLRLLCVPLCNDCFPRQFFLLVPLGLCRTTAPFVWTLPSSRYSPSVFLLLQHFLFLLETLSVPPLASKLHRFESCISMKHALPRSPSRISHLPCGTGLSFANNRVVSYPYKSLACYMCREHLSVSTQVLTGQCSVNSQRLGQLGSTRLVVNGSVNAGLAGSTGQRLGQRLWSTARSVRGSAPGQRLRLTGQRLGLATLIHAWGACGVGAREGHRFLPLARVRRVDLTRRNFRRRMGHFEFGQNSKSAFVRRQNRSGDSPVTRTWL